MTQILKLKNNHINSKAYKTTKDQVNYLEGKSIILRLLVKDDINDRYLTWLNDREVTQFTEIGTFPTSMSDLKSYYAKISQSKCDVMFAIVTKRNNVHIGNIKLGGISWIHRHADLGIMIGEKKYWGKGFGEEACKLVLSYAFNTLNLNKVILGVYGNHKAGIKAYRKTHFVVEGTIKDYFNFNGKFVDKVIMGISKRTFEQKN